MIRSTNETKCNTRSSSTNQNRITSHTYRSIKMTLFNVSNLARCSLMDHGNQGKEGNRTDHAAISSGLNMSSVGAQMIFMESLFHRMEVALSRRHSREKIFSRQNSSSYDSSLMPLTIRVARQCMRSKLRITIELLICTQGEIHICPADET